MSESNMGQFRLARTLQQLAQGERQIEVVRQMLVEEPGYDSYKLFKLLDPESNGYIDRIALKTFLRKHNIYINDEDAYALIRRYSSSTQPMNYAAFVQCLEPIGSPVRNKKSKSVLSLPSGIEIKQFTSAEERLMVYKMKTELELERTLKVMKELMSEEAEYSLYDAFRDADTNESGYLDPHEIDQALQKQGIFLTQVELSALLNKLDKNHDGKISYLEFLEELVPATPSRKRFHKSRIEAPGRRGAQTPTRKHITSWHLAEDAKAKRIEGADYSTRRPPKSPPASKSAQQQRAKYSFVAAESSMQRHTGVSGRTSSLSESKHANQTSPSDGNKASGSFATLAIIKSGVLKDTTPKHKTPTETPLTRGVPIHDFARRDSSQRRPSSFAVEASTSAAAASSLPPSRMQGFDVRKGPTRGAAASDQKRMAEEKIRRHGYLSDGRRRGVEGGGRGEGGVGGYGVEQNSKTEQSFSPLKAAAAAAAGFDDDLKASGASPETTTTTMMMRVPDRPFRSPRLQRRSPSQASSHRSPSSPYYESLINPRGGGGAGADSKHDHDRYQQHHHHQQQQQQQPQLHTTRGGGGKAGGEEGSLVGRGEVENEANAAVPPSSPYRSKTINLAQALFRKLDLNHDGKIDRQEFDRAFRPASSSSKKKQKKEDEEEKERVHDTARPRGEAPSSSSPSSVIAPTIKGQLPRPTTPVAGDNFAKLNQNHSVHFDDSANPLATPPRNTAAASYSEPPNPRHRQSYSTRKTPRAPDTVGPSNLKHLKKSLRFDADPITVPIRTLTPQKKLFREVKEEEGEEEEEEQQQQPETEENEQSGEAVRGDYDGGEGEEDNDDDDDDDGNEGTDIDSKHSRRQQESTSHMLSDSTAAPTNMNMNINMRLGEGPEEGTRITQVQIDVHNGASLTSSSDGSKTDGDVSSLIRASSPSAKDPEKFNGMESVLANVFTKQLELERELELSRVRLARLPSFKLVLAWNFIDPNENGYVTKTELRGRLKETGHDLSNMDLSLLMTAFGRASELHITYSDFLKKMMPREKKYCDIVTNHVSSDDEKLSKNASSEFARFFVELLALERGFQEIRQWFTQTLRDRADLNLHKTVAVIDEHKSGKIGFGQLRRFLAKHGVSATDQDASALMSRYDKESKGSITYLDFMDELFVA